LIGYFKILNTNFLIVDIIEFYFCFTPFGCTSDSCAAGGARCIRQPIAAAREWALRAGGGGAVRA